MRANSNEMMLPKSSSVKYHILTIDGSEGAAGNKDRNDPGHPPVQSVSKGHRHRLGAKYFRDAEGKVRKLEPSSSQERFNNLFSDKKYLVGPSFALFP